MRIIDFHSHILPGIDDGSKNVSMTEQMLETAAIQGINTMIATPHFYADSMSIQQFLRRRQTAFDIIKDMAAEKGIHIVCGAEVAFFSDMSKAKDMELLCFENTRLIMIEMPFRAWTERDLREIELLVRWGIQPIIAHLERFYRFQSDKEVIPALLDMPVYIQINTESLLHWNTRKQPLKLFKNHQAQLLGSDCHNTSSRPENLAEGRKIIEKKLGIQKLRYIDQLGEMLLGANADEGI